jgi:hypothetical protein
MGRSSQTTTQSLPQFQEEFLRGTLLPFATEFSQQEFTPYTGQMTAGVSPLSMGAQEQFGQIADIARMSPQDFAAMTQANLNPFQSQVIDAALARSQRERDIARTGEMADITRAGAFGNERRGVFEAERQAAFDIGQQQMVADLMSQGYSQAQAQTMAQLGARQGAAGQAASGMMQLGGLEQMTEQAGLDAQFQEFMRQQNLPLQQLGALTAAAGGIPAGLGSSTQTSSPGFTGVLGAIGSLGQGFGAMGATLPFSDRRLKKNIKKIGERAGVSFYSWDWNEMAHEMGIQHHPTNGVIADELADIHPDLVAVAPNGFKVVNYIGLQERV